MSWDYRVIRTKNEHALDDEERYLYSICEYYPDDNDAAKYGRSLARQYPAGYSLEELSEDLTRMTRSLEKDVVEEDAYE